MFDLSTYWLRLNYYILSHREDLKKWWIILLIAIDIFVVVFVFTNTILYLVRINQHQRSMIAMAVSPIDYQSIRVENFPQPLEDVASTAIPQANGSYDLVHIVKNNNKNWAVQEIQYQFSIDGQDTEIKTDTVMPNSEKYLTILGARDSGVGGTPEISQSIVGVQWQRVDRPDEIAGIQFSFEDIEYSKFTSPEGVTGHRVAAKVTNKSFYNFWQTKFIVVLFNGESITGVEHAYLEKFESGETRDLYTQWETVPQAVTGVEIYPDFDYLDEENIIE